MKKVKFLTKLNKEGKLEIIEPSEEVAKSYMRKSESHFEAAKILLEREKLEESVSNSEKIERIRNSLKEALV